MKKCLLILLIIGTASFSNELNAQIFSVGASGVTLKAGTIFYADGLILTPSADITLSSISLSRNSTVSHATSNPYISRVYLFSANTPVYSGTVQIDYIDPGELNSIPEANLELNVYNGTLWQSFAGTVNASANYVLSNPITNVALNELTLANKLTPLPLSWLSFTASKQNQTTFLQWSTAWEQNTQSFLVEHSTDAINWVTIGTLAAAGNSTNPNHYNYVDTNPLTGMNYYRIKQTDIDNRYSYSPVRTVLFTTARQPFTILGNPVTNGTLLVQVYTATSLSLYSADGKLLWEQSLNAGLKNIDVSRYSTGTYILRSANKTEKVVIQ